MINFPTSAPIVVSKSLKSHPRYEAFEDEVQLREGWAITVAGYDFQTDQNVSITVVHEDALSNVEDEAAFWREVQRRADVAHPSLLAIREIDAHRRWIVTDPVGETLSGVTKQRIAELPGQHTGVARGLLEGMGKLHGVGHLVGVVRSEDVCLGEAGVAKLRCLRPRRIGPNALSELGDVAWLVAPELLKAETAGGPTPSTDVYSLGVLLLGVFVGDLSKAVKSKWFVKRIDWAGFAASATEWAPATKLLPDLPTDLTKVIEKMIHKKPAARYASPQQAAAELPRVGAATVQPTTAASHGRGGVVMQRSPFAKDIASEHFKPIHPQIEDNETRIEKLFSPERVYEWAKQPLVIATGLAAMAGFFLLTRTVSAPVVQRTVAIDVQDIEGKPLLGAKLTIKNSTGVNQIYDLQGVSDCRARLPEGPYELTVSRSGYGKWSKDIEVGDQLTDPVRAVLSVEAPVQPPIQVAIEPKTPDQTDRKLLTRFAFYEREVGSGTKSEKLVACGSDYLVNNLRPGELRTLVVKAEGYLDEVVNVKYEEMDYDLTPILQRAPRWLVIHVNQPNTRLWADTTEVSGEQKSETPLGDVYRLPILHTKDTISVAVLCDGFERNVAEVPTPKGMGDLVQRIDLSPLPPPPSHPLRRIEAATNGAEIYVNGEFRGKTLLELGLPPGLHTIEIKRPDGKSRTYQVRFSDLLNQVAFDF